MKSMFTAVAVNLVVVSKALKAAAQVIVAEAPVLMTVNTEFGKDLVIGYEASELPKVLAPLFKTVKEGFEYGTQLSDMDLPPKTKLMMLITHFSTKGAVNLTEEQVNEAQAKTETEVAPVKAEAKTEFVRPIPVFTEFTRDPTMWG